MAAIAAPLFGVETMPKTETVTGFCPSCHWERDKSFDPENPFASEEARTALTEEHLRHWRKRHKSCRFNLIYS